MRVSVEHGIGDLARDCAQIGRTTQAKMARVVKKHTTEGNREARRIARAAAGPHGSNYFKRIGAEMLTPLMGEYGPEGEPKTDFVGAGYRNGGPNTDLEKSLDIVAPKFRRAVDEVLDGVFWP